MKSLFAIIITLFFCLSLYSGNNDYSGVKGGLNFANLVTENGAFNSATKLTIGSFTKYKSKSSISTQGEGYISFKGATDITFICAEIDFLGRYDFKMDLPFNPYILAGPYLGFNLRGTADGIELTDDKFIDYGGVVSFGIKFDKFSFEYRYSRGFSDIFKDYIPINHSVNSLLISYRYVKKNQFY